MTNSQQHYSPLVIGVVGGIASGKSQVTRLLGEMNATIISADEIAHRVLREPDVIDSLVKLFGNSILIENGPRQDGSLGIDRKKVAAMVFGNSAEAQGNRKQLEAIVHPRIRQIAKSELEALKRDAKVRLIILDAPLLIEGGWLPYCDRVIFVDSPDALRKQRAMERGWTAQEWHDRESAQLSLSEKRSHATDVLVNDGTLGQLQQRVSEMVASWTPA
jgi:dephospho-CoA kinase